MKEDAKKACSLINGYCDHAEKLMKRKKLYEPPVSNGHDAYDEGRIISMALNDIHGNSFDLLGYADMMYWIEMYTRQKIEGTVDPAVLTRTGSIPGQDSI